MDIPQNISIFALESIKGSHLRMDSPTEQLEPWWSVRCGSNIYKLQKFQIMQPHIYYIKFALRFTDMQIPELGLGFAACQSKNRFQRPGAKPRV